MIKESNMTLSEHLASRNAKTRAWIAEDPDNRWAGLYMEDLAHWAEIGVQTVAQFERYEMESTIWDLYKDVTGIRPRHMDFKSMSDEDLKREYDYLVSQLDRQLVEEEEWEAVSMAYIQEDAEEDNRLRDELPLPIDYVACHYQEGWL